MRFRVFVSVLIFAIAFGGAWLYLERVPSELPSRAPSEGRGGDHIQISELPPLSKPQATNDAKNEAAGSEDAVTHIQGIAANFRDRANLRALVHNASVSKDPVRLYYSRLYLTRCITAIGIENVIKDNALAPSQASSSVIAASRRFADFCGPFLGDPAEYRKNEFYAVSNAPNYLSSDRGRLRDSQGLTAAAAVRDAEWFIETFLTMDTRQKVDIVEPTAADVAHQHGLGLYLAMIDAATIVEVCSRWGCDSEYRMAASCVIEQRACKADGLEAQFVEMLSADNNTKPQIEAGIRLMREKISQWITKL